MLPSHGLLSDLEIGEYLESYPSDPLKLRSYVTDLKLPFLKAIYITPTAFYTFLDQSGLLVRWRSQIQALNPTSHSSLTSLSQSMAQAVLTHPLPKNLIRAFQALYDLQPHAHYLLTFLTAASAHQPFLTQPESLYRGDAAILQAVRLMWSQLITPDRIKQSLAHGFQTDLNLPLIVLIPLPQVTSTGLITSALINDRSKTLCQVQACPGYDLLFSDRDCVSQTFVINRQTSHLVNPHSQISGRSLGLDRHGRLTRLTRSKFNPSIPLINPLLFNQITAYTKQISNRVLRPFNLTFIVSGSQIYFVHLSYLDLPSQAYQSLDDSSQNRLPNPATPLATKIFLDLSSPYKATQLASLPVDGILLPPSTPNLIQSVSNLNQLFPSKPIYYTLSSLNSKASERELAALSHLRQHEDSLSLHLIIPSVVNPTSLLQLKRLLATHHLSRSGNLSHFFNVSSTLCLLELPTLLELGFDGLVINLDRLFPQLKPPVYYASITRFLAYALKSVDQSKIKVILSGSILTAASDYILDAVKNGFYGLSTSPPTVRVLADRLSFAESRLFESISVPR